MTITDKKPKYVKMTQKYYDQMISDTLQSEDRKIEITSMKYVTKDLISGECISLPIVIDDTIVLSPILICEGDE